ncbi:3-hydroxybutyrate dehydrogenase [Basidiobolus meristosporus CBS 931.73]|uniref:3-oxoacyl-[acyl-carrier-protein] reductase n=1 Tax=Basidiobolus meristosporus CBS 931.73 TaxID=1314790 RepID=A0A1Y1XUJ7_9FUNG|nr:3-hydroxybutyrate dehydrogenase [Basidiobolus meristosporus CBS 931.73]|eukprot:ORX89166.1 3-hydroxybutyrate dehydrogenase [Basidiobolus meristosporus CBS 931.73]
MSATFNFEGKVVVVAGGSSGVGLAVTQAFSKAGAKVHIAATNETKGAAVAKETKNVVFHQCDLTNPRQIQKLVDEVVSEDGGCDILIPAAGYVTSSKVEELPEKTWRDAIDLMLTAPFLLAQHFLPPMYRRKWGRIVNIGSAGSLHGLPTKVAYTSAKHGLIGLTKVIALEANEHGVTCNSVCPTYIRTPPIEEMISQMSQEQSKSTEQIIQEIAPDTGCKRLLEPSEVANYVLYLCTDLAAGINGSAATIDCGHSAL